jgi:dolichol-phosphate mannosyltransferase
MFLSIVIAAYNEGGNLKELTSRIYTSLKKISIPFELIYVIDGTDNSLGVLKKIGKSKKNLILDYSAEPRGFKASFVKGFSLLNKKATHVLTMDADLNHQPEQIKDMIEMMSKAGCDIVVGSRYAEKGKIKGLALWKRGISIFANLIMRILWSVNIMDKTSGFRLYKREVIDKIIPRCKSSNFEFLFEILILAKRFNYGIEEAPIVFRARKSGKSKFQLFKIISGYLRLTSRYPRK